MTRDMQSAMAMVEYKTINHTDGFKKSSLKKLEDMGLIKSFVSSYYMRNGRLHTTIRYYKVV
jgi:hypothetical protein